jgi:hypothetical protein
MTSGIKCVFIFIISYVYLFIVNKLKYKKE